LRNVLLIELGGPEKPMGWASMKSLSGPAHGLEPTAQQLGPLARNFLINKQDRGTSVARKSEIIAHLGSWYYAANAKPQPYPPQSTKIPCASWP
jgi:hypothetical protein